MDAFVEHVLYNPMPLIATVMSFLAAIAFLGFLRGFVSGVRNFWTYNLNDDHLLHARIRTIQGFLWLVILFGAWETIRFVAAAFVGEETPNNLWIVIPFVLWCVWLLVRKQFKKGGGGH